MGEQGRRLFGIIRVVWKMEIKVGIKRIKSVRVEEPVLRISRSDMGIVRKGGRSKKGLKRRERRGRDRFRRIRLVVLWTPWGVEDVHEKEDGRVGRTERMG